jgi:hypothetical protein
MPSNPLNFTLQSWSNKTSSLSYCCPVCINQTLERAWLIQHTCGKTDRQTATLTHYLDLANCSDLAHMSTCSFSSLAEAATSDNCVCIHTCTRIRACTHVHTHTYTATYITSHDNSMLHRTASLTSYSFEGQTRTTHRTTCGNRQSLTVYPQPTYSDYTYQDKCVSRTHTWTPGKLQVWDFLRVYVR